MRCGPSGIGVCAVPFTVLWLALNDRALRPWCLRLNLGAFRRRWACPWSDAPLAERGPRVVVAGLGRTGTTSMQVALEQLGLRTYKDYEMKLYMPHALREGITAHELFDRLRHCGVDAVIPEPYHHLTRSLLSSNFSLRVIVMKRRYEDRNRSLDVARTGERTELLSRTLSQLCCHWLPHGFLWPAKDPGSSLVDGSITSAFLKYCVFPERWALHFQAYTQHEIQSQFLNIHSEAEYHEFYDFVRGVVPPSRLLEFDVSKHGWNELTAFLGRPPLPDGSPFPRVRIGTVSHSSVLWQLSPLTCIVFEALLLGSMLVNFLVACCLSAVAVMVTEALLLSTQPWLLLGRLQLSMRLQRASIFLLHLSRRMAVLE